MSFRNYVSKISFAINHSVDVKSFFRLLINSKRYSTNFKSNSLNPFNKEIKIYKLNFEKPTDLKIRTFSGDFDVFYEVFWRKMYEIPENYLQNPKVIIDLGAHAGYTAVFFGLKYPNAKIFSVEASPKNYEVLKWNASKFNNIKVYNNAVYHTQTSIGFEDSSISYNQKISERSTSKIDTITIDKILSENQIQEVDLLKVDIEGAEKELFSKNKEWLHKVRNIIIELHHPYETENLENDLKDFGFTIINPPSGGLKNIFAFRK